MMHITQGEQHAIVGRAGTGKTSALQAEYMSLLDRADSDSILYITYTRAARAEMLERISAQHPDIDPDKIHIYTLHSAIWKILRGTKTLFTSRGMKKFNEECGYDLKLSQKWDFDESTGNFSQIEGPDAKLMSIHSYMLNAMLPSVDAAMIAMNESSISATRALEFTRDYTAFKQDNNYVDFTDIISAAIDSQLVFSSPHILIDEAQDLSRLQVAAIRSLCSAAQTLTIAFDDDQSIFGFQGADPAWLIDYTKAAQRVTRLEISYRVPPRIRAVAESMIHRNPDRVPKRYLPRPGEPEGYVQALPESHIQDVLRDIHEAGRSCFLLVRNTHYLKKHLETCHKWAIPYICDVNSKMYTAFVDSTLYAAVTALHRLLLGESIPPIAIRNIFAYTTMIKNPKQLLEDTTDFITLADIQASPLWQIENEFMDVLKNEHPSAVLNRLTSEVSYYFQRLIHMYPNGLVRPTIQMSTIHGAKGREADVVIIDPCISKRSYNHAFEYGNWAEEHRIAYVALTRAKEELYILLPERSRTKIFPYPFKELN